PAAGSGKILLILVFNVPESLRGSDKHQQTRSLAGRIKQLPFLQHCNDTASLHRIRDDQHVLVVDRYSDTRLVPDREGVGLARKIGVDIACRLFAEGHSSGPWIYSSDADVTVPSAYFNASSKMDELHTAAALFPFRHSSSGSRQLDYCQSLYDFSLYYYVAGLRWAGSPYAFHTIGSTLLINARHYVQVRGFPRRNAAEDFYLLNKLAKTGHIATLEAPVISIKSRTSDRVPFGTGPALAGMLQMQDPARQYLFYHPLVFTCLKELLGRIELLWEQQRFSQTSGLTDLLIPGPEQQTDSIINPKLFRDCLQALDFEKALLHSINHGKTRRAFQKQFHHWFDGFRTLKFIHFLRD
ncbi:MAG: hypothetical protein WD601_08685, partial [Pseudohongiellaceae bacterium]